MIDTVKRDDEYGVRPGIERSSELDQAVIVALGGNDKGGRTSCRETLEAALQRLEQDGVHIVARSSWWSSLAWPDPNDPPFLNGVVILRTDLRPNELMGLLSRIEDEFGRKRSTRNAPRTLDLDLIACGRLSGDFDGLILPHPRAADRLFVMGPLAEIAPDWVHPVIERTAKELAQDAPVGRDAHAI